MGSCVSSSSHNKTFSAVKLAALLSKPDTISTTTSNDVITSAIDSARWDSVVIDWFPRGDAHGHANVFRAVKQCLPGPGLDVVVDGGLRVPQPSTFVDMSGSYPKVIREGKGPILPCMVVEDDESLLRQHLIASGT